MELSRFKGLGAVTIIESGSVAAVIDSLGAKCLALMIEGQNQLFYEESDIGHSGIPICFPSFGPLDNQELIHGGKAWPMKQHGFARDMELKLIETTDRLARYELTENEETLKRYPFKFQFVVTHQLQADGLSIELSIHNRSNEPMPISPGIHPYFSVDDPATVTVTTKADFGHNNLNDYQKEILTDAKCFEIANEKDGIKTLQIHSNPDQHLPDHGLKVTRLTRGNQRAVSIDCDLSIFKMMTIWRKTPEAKYICVEPANFKNGLNIKPNWIAPDETVETQIRMTFEKI